MILKVIEISENFTKSVKVIVIDFVLSQNKRKAGQNQKKEKFLGV